MSTTFDYELKRIFNAGVNLKDIKYVGRNVYGVIDNKLKFKAEFISTEIQNHFDALRFRIIHKDDGELDATTIRFNEIWGQTSYMWYSDKLVWYTGNPNSVNIEKLVSTLNDYISIFA